MSKYLVIETVAEQALPVQAFMQHIPNGQLYYVTIAADVKRVTLKVLQDAMNEKLPTLAEEVKDFIQLQLDNITMDTVIIGSDGTQSVVHFSLHEEK